MRRQLFRALLLLCLATTVTIAQQQQPEPVRIPIECEDMQGVKTGPEGFTRDWTFGKWGRDLHQNMIFGGVWASRMAAAITDAGDNAAEIYQDIEIPRADRYKIWAKYECPPFFNYAFAIRIAPLDAGGTPGAAVFQKTYGLRTSAKHFCFTDGETTGDLYWAWGIDHDAAEGYEVDLPAGKYRITLGKAPNVQPAGERSVDAILITTRLSKNSSPDFPRYPLLDELQQINHVYFRFTNTGAQPMTISYNHWSHRYNDFYYMGHTDKVRFFGADGAMLQKDGQPLIIADGAWKEPIAPGQSSPWIDLGPTMTVECGSPFTMQAKAVDDKGVALARQPDDVPFSVDIALAPDAKQIVKSFSKVAGEPMLSLNVQPDLHRAEGVDWTLTGQGVYERISTALNALPRIGPMPKKLRLYGGSGSMYVGTTMKPNSLEMTTYLNYRMALGLNTLGYDFANPDNADAIVAYYKEKQQPIIELSGTYHHTQDPKFLEKNFSDPRVKARFYYNSFGDEIGLPAVNINDAQQTADFRAFLKALKVDPKSIGFTTLEMAKPLPGFTPAAAAQVGVIPSADTTKSGMPTGEAGAKVKRLYWYTHLFVVSRGVADFAKKTEEIRQLFGPNIRTSANLGGMHPFYWVNQDSFIESFRGNAMTMGWSEDYDYGMPEASRLTIEYLGAMLRAGAKYHDTPMMFYAMPHFPGNTERHLVQNVATLWGQGVKDLDFFGVAPDMFTTENYIHSRGGMETAGAIRRISGMAGNIEDDLLPARTRRARIAMIVSQASDVWEVGGGSQWNVNAATADKPATVETNASQEERKNIWYALRNAGYQVDIITENDVADGYLKNYAVAYICGHNLESRTAKTLAQWVNQGGIIFLTAGAARKDEFDQPSTAMDALVGRGRVVTADYYRGPLRARLELLQLTAKDQVSVKLGASLFTYDAFASREAFMASPKAEVFGLYSSNKQPAVVRTKTGKGWGYYTGTLPGQAFVRKGIPLRVMGKGGLDTNFSHFEPVNFDTQAQAVILAPVRAAGLQPEATFNIKNVVATILDGPKSTVVTLVNLGRNLNGPALQVQVTLHGVRKATSVRTAMKALGVTFANTTDGVTVTLPELDDADVLVITH